MPKYSVTKQGNVIECKWNCKCNHEHFVGTYERAVKYFGIDQDEIKSWGNLLNIVIYHQTSQYTIPKLSNELYDLLIDAMSEHKYWVIPKERDKVAKEILKEANKLNLILDEKICKTILKKGNLKSKNRVHMLKIWQEQQNLIL